VDDLLEPPRAREAARGCAAAVGWLSVVGAVLIFPLAMISPMGLDGGGDLWAHIVVYTLFLSPALLLVSTASAFFCYRQYSHAAFALTLLPFLAVAAAWSALG
jgi:hypothetical protein